jgi:prolyl-tRNA synthetase
VRPRFGLMRGREFIMKDMYSFDITRDDALRTYQHVVGAYTRILAQLELDYVIAAGTY